jgi:hypothetical protein
MTAGADCKFTVPFSTLFCTTRPFSVNNGTLLFGRHSDSRLRHLLRDFRKGRFGRLFLVFFLLIPHHKSGRRPQVNLEQAHHLPACYSATGWLPPSPLSGLLT